MSDLKELTVMYKLLSNHCKEGGSWWSIENETIDVILTCDNSDQLFNRIKQERNSRL